jgi:valyl-tRNA synthetase
MNRLLWEEHVNWTRMTITSIVFNLPDLKYVQERLLRNATDMGNCLRPFYGDRLADRYAELIKEHLVLAAELVTAAAKGDEKGAAEKEREWYRNADDIAQFLSSINPYLDKEVIRSMFYTHLALTKFEAVSMIEKKYKEDVAVFDKIEAEALEMADAISDGIIKQFPGIFGLYCTY